MSLWRRLKYRAKQWLHNCVAHPLEGWVVLLIGFCPEWIDRFHDWTDADIPILFFHVSIEPRYQHAMDSPSIQRIQEASDGYQDTPAS